MGDRPDPATVADAAATFCADDDDGEAVLETVLTVDGEHDTWTFDELPVDSGTFGELVSRGIVTKADGQYRVASREGVRAALEGTDISADDEESAGGLEFLNPIATDRRTVGGVLGALALLVAMRLVNYRSVFQEGKVVSPENDPYYYRYWMEELLAESAGVTDVGTIADMLGQAGETRPLTHAANWFFVELLGGDQWAADMVAAWLPVVATLALGIVVYWLAVVVTDDVRVAIASVVLLALTPAHAVYTGVGFLEHRLYQYFWLGVTLLALSWLAVDLQRRIELDAETQTAVRDHLQCHWTWLAAVVLGVALCFSAHIWGGSILLFVPVAAYVAMKVAIDTRAGLSPALANTPLLVGLGIGGLGAAFLHFRWGWHEVFAALVPLLVVVGTVVVIGLGELWRRLEWRVGGLVGLEIGIGAVGLVAFRALWPDNWARILEQANTLFFREHHGATETGSLFATSNSIVLEPMAQLGLTFYLAIVVLVWACWLASRRYEPGWLLLAVYTVFWLVLAAFQVRFAAQLAIPLSVLGGFGFVYLLAWADLARAPTRFRETEARIQERPSSSARDAAVDGGTREPSIIVPQDVRTLVTLAWIALLVLGMGLFFVPSLSAQTTHGEAEFEATMAIEDHATATDRADPETYVFSRWGDSRMHNYFVNGEADGYGYALNNFDEFQVDGDPDSWCGEFDESDVGYVVFPGSGDAPEDTAQMRLHEELGTGGAAGDPLEHYQALYVDEDATAFAVVPGANLTASGEPGETITVATEHTVPGETIQYERDATVDEDGTLEVTVPYPGEYSVGESTVDVPPEAVENGDSVQVA